MNNKTIQDLFPALAALFVEDNNKHLDQMGWYDNRMPYDISFEEGRTYTRIVIYNGTQRMCNGFVCMKDVTTKQGSFKAGDLLKCATWKAPALNFARGSIFDLAAAKKRICWTGIS